jgi:hypothetical protein
MPKRVVLIPLMQKYLLMHIYIYLFIRTKRGIMKVKIYKGFTYVHCLFVVAKWKVNLFSQCVIKALEKKMTNLVTW